MKKFMLSVLFAVFGLAAFAQNEPVYVQNTSGPNVCDGFAYVMDSVTYESWQWQYNGVVQDGGYLSNLCPGSYTVSLTSNGTTSVYTFTVGFGSGTGCETFYAYFSNIVHPSGFNSLDGIIEVLALGGTAPYTYVWSNGDLSNMIVYLNPGTYSVVVSDANGCTSQLEMTLFTDSTSVLCNDFYATVSTTNNTSNDPASCNGTAIITPYGGTSPYTFESNNSILIDGNMSNLCEGGYYTLVTDANGCTFYNQFYIGNGNDTILNPDLYVYPYTTNVSDEDVCDGSVFLDVYGGLAPYTFINADGQISEQYVTGLCEGVYTAIVQDASGQTFTVNYFIASPDNIIDNGGNYDDTLFVTDTLYNNVIEDCIIDYLSLDTAYISNIEFVTVDSILVTWAIIDGNGTTEIVESYNISGLGYYELILQIFCPTRAENKYLIVKQRMLLTGSMSSISENTKSNIQFYPNPVNEFLTISSNALNNEVTIHDITGKLVYKTVEKNQLIQIDFNTFSKGQYIVTLKNDKTTITEKVIK